MDYCDLSESTDPTESAADTADPTSDRVSSFSVALCSYLALSSFLSFASAFCAFSDKSYTLVLIAFTID